MAELRKTSPMETDFSYALDVLTRKINTNFNCIRIGRIIEYDKTLNTCTVKILTLRQFNDVDITDYPPLTDIPLIILCGGGGELTFPSPVGQDCVLLANDRDIDLWFEGGESYTPNTNRTHDLSDCIALCGVRNLLNPLIDYDETATTLRNKDTFLRLNENLATLKSLVKYVDEDEKETVTSAVLSVYGGNGNNEGGEILAESSQGGEVDITANVVAKSSANSEVNISTGILSKSSQNGQVNITDKVNVSNSSQSLASLMSEFITRCSNISCSTSTGDLRPAFKQDFLSLKAKFEQLLN